MSALSLLVLLGTPAQAMELPDLPSGRVAELYEVIWDHDVEIARFRLLDPQIAGTISDDAVAEDLMVLCTDYALPLLGQYHPEWQEIVISFESAPGPFGVSNPQITKFFEVFAVTDEGCIWGAF